jgi:hypothetical protein
MSTIAPSVAVTPQTASIAAPPKPAKADHKGFTFGDFLDIINPLQHLPVISTIYRRLTGDQMSPTAEIAGGALFGGVMGAVASIADVIWTQATGKDFGNTVISWLGLDSKDQPIQLAKADVKPLAPTQPASEGIASTLALQASASAPARGTGDFDPGLPTLIDAMEKQGVAPAVALRAAAAYRNAIGLTNLPLPELAPAY